MTVSDLWLDRLSRMTIYPGCKVGSKTSRTNASKAASSTTPSSVSMCSRGNEDDTTRIGERRRSGLIRTMRDNSLTNEIEAVAPLLAAGVNGGKAQGALGNVVRSFDARMRGEGPQGRFEGVQIGSGAGLS
jgi:hypothetical protein